MSTLTVNWIHLALIGLVVAVVVVGLLAVAGIVLHLFRGNGKPATPSGTLLQKAEAVAQRVEASPIAQVAVADVEKAVSAALARLQSAPPVTINNHPALTAVADVIQESAATKQALATAAAAVADAAARTQAAASALTKS